MKLYRAKREQTGYDEPVEGLVWAMTARDARKALETDPNSGKRYDKVDSASWTVEAVRLPANTPTILLMQTRDG